MTSQITWLSWSAVSPDRALFYHWLRRCPGFFGKTLVRKHYSYAGQLQLMLQMNKLHLLFLYYYFLQKRRKKKRIKFRRSYLPLFWKRTYFHGLQSWTVLQYLYFSVVSRFPLKRVRLSSKFSCSSPSPHPIQSWNSEKFCIHASNIVCGVRGGVGTVCIGKRSRNAKVSQDDCPWL